METPIWGFDFSKARPPLYSETVIQKADMERCWRAPVGRGVWDFEVWGWEVDMIDPGLRLCVPAFSEPETLNPTPSYNKRYQLKQGPKICWKDGFRAYGPELFYISYIFHLEHLCELPHILQPNAQICPTSSTGGCLIKFLEWCA